MSKHPKLLGLSLACLAFSGLASATPASDEVARLAQRCAPDVSPLTMAYIVGHESSNGPYRININGSTQLKQQPRTEDEAVTVAKVLLKDNKSFDMGLAQINSNNLVGLGISVEHIFNPCTNLRASQTILKACYDSALKSYPAGQVALRHALSCYNTGSLTNGISNGYVTKIINVARQSTDLKIPTLLPDGQTSEDSTATEPQQAKSSAPAYDGEQDVFGSGDGDAFSRENTDAFLTKQETAKGE